MKKEKIKKEKKEEIEKKADEKTEETIESVETIEQLDKQIIELKKQREELKTKEEKPEIVVAPRCTMEIIENEETGIVDVVYSKNCGGKRIRDIAGKIALDGVRFRPKTEEKKITETTKEERKKEFDQKVSECKLATAEDLEKQLTELKKQREELDTEPSAETSEKPDMRVGKELFKETHKSE